MAEKKWSELAGRAAQERKTREEEEKAAQKRQQQHNAEVWAQKEIHDAWRSTEGHALRDLVLSLYQAALFELRTAETHERSIALRAELRVYEELLGLSKDDETLLRDMARRIVGFRRQ